MAKKLTLIKVLYLSTIILCENVVPNLRYIKNTNFSNVTLENFTNCKKLTTISSSLTECGLFCSLYACDTFYYSEDNGQCDILVFLTAGIPIVPQGMDNYIANKVCQPGWLQFNSNCILLIKTRLNWYYAQAECIRLGAKLINLQSNDLNDFARRVAVLCDCSDLWVGARKTDVWRWVDNSAEIYVNHSNWASENPNGRGNCMHLWSYNMYMWDDIYCSYPKAFICQSMIIS